MTDPIQEEVARHQEEGIQRELFGTRLGFILAAVGSAVGLGNMWRFPYQAAEGGGAAFVTLYVVLTAVIGIPLMLSEFAVGRRARLSPIGALRKVGGPTWSKMGFLFVLTGFLILSYYSVIAGWTVRYALQAIIGGFPTDPGAHFAEISTGGPAIMYHLAFMAVTIVIVMAGVEKGIERAAMLLMPALFVILIGLAFWASQLDGGGEGYAFYLRPSFGELLNPRVLSAAAGQAFFSLSLGMGAMLTFSSYLSKHENLNRESVIIATSDFSIAFIAGLVVFPVIFALGLSGQVSDSTVGALFIALPGAFVQMGALGRFVGILFFAALVVGAVTSAVSLLEVVTASLIDEFKLQRKRAAIGAGLLIALVGLLPALSLNVLGAIDKVTEFFLALGGLGTAIFVGWAMKNPENELLDGAVGLFRSMVPTVLKVVKWVLPPIIAYALFFTFLDMLAEIRGLIENGF